MSEISLFVRLQRNKTFEKRRRHRKDRRPAYFYDVGEGYACDSTEPYLSLDSFRRMAQPVVAVDRK